jgi:preprotein translocase subunit SecF
MEFFKPGSLNVDFMGKKNQFLWISTVAVLLSIGIFVWRNANGTLNWGIDFAGGTVIDLEFDKTVDIGAVRKSVGELGYSKAVIQHSAFSNQQGRTEFIIRVERIAILSAEDATKLSDGLKGIFGDRFVNFEFDKDSGDQFAVTFTSAVAETEIRKALAEMAEKLGKQDLADVNVRVPAREGDFRYNILITGVATQIQRAMAKAYPDSNPHVRKVEFVGPEVGSKMRTDALLAMIYTFLGILVYVGFRFNVLFAPGAVIALIHDSFITIGIFALFRLEMNLTFLAAVLTIIGYSINDTIVIYDRIRENMGRLRSQPLDQVMNSALNDTLGRTINTSLATELSLVGLLLMGFGEIQDFAIAMTIGIVVGTYSSIYVASSLTLVFDKMVKKHQANA